MTEAPNLYVADAPFPLSSAWGASSYWDTREPRVGWQRVPGCARVVHAAIPDPTPFYAPEWCGERGVPTKSGKVFDKRAYQREYMRKRREALKGK